MRNKKCCVCGKRATITVSRTILKEDGTYDFIKTYWCSYDWAELQKDLLCRRK
jgi:hypothetical protein